MSDICSLIGELLYPIFRSLRAIIVCLGNMDFSRAIDGDRALAPTHQVQPVQVDRNTSKIHETSAGADCGKDWA